MGGVGRVQENTTDEAYELWNKGWNVERNCGKRQYGLSVSCTGAFSSGLWSLSFGSAFVLAKLLISKH